MVSNVVFAQQIYRIRMDANGYCGFSTTKGYFSNPGTEEYITRKASVGDDSGIADVVASIKSVLGANGRIDIYVAMNEDNASATIIEGQKALIADHHFLNRMDTGAGTKWAAISVLAHEVGHHISGLGRGLQGELDADYWSGYALQKLGAGRDASIRAIMRYGSEYDTKTHPRKYLRASNIQQGWDDAQRGTYDRNRCVDCN